MANRRRSSASSERQISPASSSASYERSPVRRQTSIRLSRNGSPNRASGTGRVSGGRSGASGGSMRIVASSSRAQSARTRRPTPVVRRNRKVSIAADNSPVRSSSDSGSQVSSAAADELDEESESQPRRKPEDKSGSSKRSMRLEVDTSAGRRRGNQSKQQTLRMSTSQSAGRSLAWYERLLPECFLSITAPLTGYETRLEQGPDEEPLDEHELEILDRYRLRRNRRVRRRLITIMMLAAAAGLVMYTRGRFVRKVGMKAAMSSVKHRLEDGLAKTIHDTMGK